MRRDLLSITINGTQAISNHRQDIPTAHLRRRPSLDQAVKLNEETSPTSVPGRTTALRRSSSIVTLRIDPSGAWRSFEPREFAAFWMHNMNAVCLPNLVYPRP